MEMLLNGLKVLGILAGCLIALLTIIISVIMIISVILGTIQERKNKKYLKNYAKETMIELKNRISEDEENKPKKRGRKPKKTEEK